MEGGLSGVHVTLISDCYHKLSRDYDVLIKEEGVAVNTAKAVCRRRERYYTCSISCRHPKRRMRIQASPSEVASGAQYSL